MSGSCHVLSHTADTGIHVQADTLAELYEWSARGMFGLMFDLAATSPRTTVRLVLDAPQSDDLLVDLLSELLYRSETNDVVPCRFTVSECSVTRVDIEVGLAPIAEAHLHGPPIKAVTYHNLLVEQGRDGRWSATIVFDV